MDLTSNDIHAWLGQRPLNAHKGLFGHVLVIGSDDGMPGAVRLCAEGALRTGAGLVTVITKPAHVASVVSGRPELMCYGIDTIDMHFLNTLMNKITVIALGPGLGQSAWSKQWFDYGLSLSKPIIADADALNF